VGVPVVAQRPGVFHGQVGHLLVVVAGRVAPLGDQLRDELVGLVDGPVRVVEKLGLDLVPGGGVALARLGAEFAQLELGVAALAFAQFAFGGEAAISLSDRAIVLRAEPLLERATAGEHHERGNDCEDDDDHDDEDDYGRR
jgi:hypothetical protein